MSASFSSNDDDGDIDFGEISLFPMTDCGSYESESEHFSETESTRDASDERDSDDDEKAEADRCKSYLTLRQRRLSRALAAFESLKVNVSVAQKNWLRAIKKARNMEDPWEEFHLDEYPTETCIRHRYSALKKAWVTDHMRVKMETKVITKKHIPASLLVRGWGVEMPRS